MKSSQGGGFAWAPCQTKFCEYALYQRVAFSLRKVAAKVTRLCPGTRRSSQYCSIWKIHASRDSPFFPVKGGGRSGFKLTTCWGSGLAWAAGRALKRSSMRSSWAWRLRITVSRGSSRCSAMGVSGSGRVDPEALSSRLKGALSGFQGSWRFRCIGQGLGELFCRPGFLEGLDLNLPPLPV